MSNRLPAILAAAIILGPTVALAHPAASQFTIEARVLHGGSNTTDTVQAHTRIGSTCTLTETNLRTFQVRRIGPPLHVRKTGIVRWIWREPARPSGATVKITCTWKAITEAVILALAFPPKPRPHPTPTPQPTQAVPAYTAWANQYDSGETYQHVDDHPNATYGDGIVWACVIVKFLGNDQNTPGNTDIGCNEFTGSYDGIGDGEIVLNTPPSIDTSAMDTGDELTVYGTVDAPWQGLNGFGAQNSWVQIDAVYLVDQGNYATLNGLGA